MVPQLPLEIIEMIFNASSWAPDQLCKMQRVCKLFKNIVRTNRNLRVFIPFQDSRIFLFMKMYDLNKHITMVVDMKKSFFALPMCTDIPIACVAHNFHWDQDGFDWCISKDIAYAVIKFLSFSKNKIRVADCTKPLCITIKHGDTPEDYDAIMTACRLIGCQPRTLLYKKSGAFLHLPEFPGEKFETRKTFSTIQHIVLDGFSFGDFLSLKRDSLRFPHLPNAKSFKAENFLKSENIKHHSLFLKEVCPILTSGNYKVYKKCQIVQA